LIYWTPAGVQFVDVWAVRRRAFPLLGQGVDNPWPMHAGQRRLAEAEATLFQFQDQLADIVATVKDLPGVNAATYFKYLPAGGFLPITPPPGLESPRINFERRFFPFLFAKDIAPGFDQATFFQGFTFEEAELDVAFVRWLIEQSWFLEPIDVDAPPLLRLYKTGAGAPWLLFIRQEKRPAAPPKPGAIEVTLRFTRRELFVGPRQ